MEDEFHGDEYIKEVVVGGAKSYSYTTNEGKLVVQQKGITLDRGNSDKFTFEQVQNTVLKGETLQSEKRH